MAIEQERDDRAAQDVPRAGAVDATGEVLRQMDREYGGLRPLLNAIEQKRRAVWALAAAQEIEAPKRVQLQLEESLRVADEELSDAWKALNVPADERGAVLDAYTAAMQRHAEALESA